MFGRGRLRRTIGNGYVTERNDPVDTAKVDMRSEQYSSCERIGLRVAQSEIS